MSLERRGSLATGQKEAGEEEFVSWKAPVERERLKTQAMLDERRSEQLFNRWTGKGSEADTLFGRCIMVPATESAVTRVNLSIAHDRFALWKDGAAEFSVKSLMSVTLRSKRSCVPELEVEGREKSLYPTKY